MSARDPHRVPSGVVPAVLVLTLLLAAGCGSGPADVTATATTSASADATSADAADRAAGRAVPAPSAWSSSSACVRTTLAGLDDAQRVGQLFAVGLQLSDPSGADRTVTVAGRLHLGNYFFHGRSSAGTTAVRRLTTSAGRTLAAGADGVRPFAAADQEGGQVQALRGKGFEAMPTALVQGGWTVERLTAASARWGRQLAAAGVNVDLAPVADVVPTEIGRRNAPVGRYDREFGHTAATTTPAVVAFTTGLQSAGVLATVKHFPGLGRVQANTDVSSGVTDTAITAASADLEPFRKAVDAGAGVVMLSSAVYTGIDPGTPAVFSTRTVGLLRDSLHFQGLVASDDLGAAKQLASVPAGQRAVRFLRAGGQLAVVVGGQGILVPMTTAVRDEVRRDPAFRRTVDAAVVRVLAAKAAAGLLTC